QDILLVSGPGGDGIRRRLARRVPVLAGKLDWELGSQVCLLPVRHGQAMPVLTIEPDEGTATRRERRAPLRGLKERTLVPRAHVEQNVVMKSGTVTGEVAVFAIVGPGRPVAFGRRVD